MTTKQAQHTTTPWKVKDNGDAVDVFSNETFLLEMEGTSDKARVGKNGWRSTKQVYTDAAFIVEACNNYDRLVAERDALLEACQNLREYEKKNPLLPDEVVHPILQAIFKVEELEGKYNG